jgi:tetratricopeptide (TPR) repeat protein
VLRRFDEAIKAYDKAIEINPQNSGAWFNKGYDLDNLENI